jgi:hypothetical protein
MIQVDVGLLEVSRQPWVERIQRQRPGRELRVLRQGLEEVPPIPAGGFGRDLQAVERTGRHLLGQALSQDLGARAVVVDAETRSDFVPLVIHHADHVGLAVGIHPHQERTIGHQDLLSGVVLRDRREVGKPWHPMRATASR